MNPSEEDHFFELLLRYLKQVRGFDFTGYKRASLKRRVLKQMQDSKIESFDEYRDYLEVHPEEFSKLFNTILINVTSFFRDLAAWEHLQNQTLPIILSNRSSKTSIRVWSAGCASGEEAYTLAIVLAELIGINNFSQRVKIYATDVDEEALTQARQASYKAKQVETISPDLINRYFERIGDRYIVCSDLRRAVIFGRHDLVQDAPISHLDLLVCRNTLMYFNTEAQKRILARFHFALNEVSSLFLGKAEMLLTHTSLFSPLSVPHRIFTKVPQFNWRERLLVFDNSEHPEIENSFANYMKLREAAFNAIGIAQIVVDTNGIIILANLQARLMFNLNHKDIGRPLQDLEISYRPVELRSRIDQVYSDRHPVLITDISYSGSDRIIKYLEVQISPLQEESSELLGVSIIFTDVTRYQELKMELQRSTQELETANEELQSSNEELETTNEELQSTNEELETTNEELQSTNEELETMNEELQSTNEELQTINTELRMLTVELNQTNAFLSSVLASLKAAVTVIDRQFNILTWNSQAEDLWGLRTDEVTGQSLFSLDIGLPLEPLQEPLRNCLIRVEEYNEITLEALNRRGRKFQCCVRISPLNSVDQSQPRGVILVMEEI